MTIDNARAFLKKVAGDPDLRAQVEALASDGAAAVGLGAAQGFTFTADDFVAAYDEAFGDLTDDELSDAAGGLGGLKPSLDFD